MRIVLVWVLRDECNSLDIFLTFTIWLTQSFRWSKIPSSGSNRSLTAYETPFQWYRGLIWLADN